MKKNNSNEIEMTFPKTKMQWILDIMGKYKWLYLVGIFGTILYNIMQITVPYFSGTLVDEFLTGENAAYNFANNRPYFYQLIASMVGFTFLRVCIVYGTCFICEVCSQTVLYKVRTALFDKIEHQDMKFFAKYRTGDLMTRLTGDMDAVRHMIAWVVRAVIESIALVSATAIYFFYMDWLLALSLLVLAPIIFIIIVLFKNESGPMHRQLRERLSAMNTAAQENIAGNRVVKAFAREEYENNKFDNTNKDYRDTNEKTALVWIKYFPYMEMMANLLPVILLLVGGLFIIGGRITVGEYFAFSCMIWAIANPMRQLGMIMNEFQRFNAGATKVMELYYSEPEIKDHEDAVDVSDRLKGKIEFNNVSFRYPDGNLPVLNGVSFSAEPGETIAIIGETGCGKTSLIQMIPRFYEAIDGEILIDGVNVNDYKLKQLRTNIGFATQDVLLYSDSIDNNIAFGDSDLSMKEIEKYAKYSQAAHFISKMPDGYGTVVGERGVGLSGGQKQRISLARALAVRPSILILDDTTSAVDMETEKLIQESLENLDFECTKIIIAQRISTTKKADKILVLKDGHIIESGSHTDLINQGGYYYELVKLQYGEEAV